jgi:hypothetical protein
MMMIPMNYNVIKYNSGISVLTGKIIGHAWYLIPDFPGAVWRHDTPYME